MLGVGNGSSAFVKDLPLIIAFVILAAYTYTSGLRAPAMSAFVKHALIYIVIAVLYIPIRLGGYGHIFSAVHTHANTVNAAAVLKHKKAPFAFVPGHSAYWSTPPWRSVRPWRCSCIPIR